MIYERTSLGMSVYKTILFLIRRFFTYFYRIYRGNNCIFLHFGAVVRIIRLPGWLKADLRREMEPKLSDYARVLPAS